MSKTNGIQKVIESLKGLRWTDVCKLALLTAIPIAVGLGSWWANWYSHKASLNRDYVQLAIQILQKPSKENPGLREWAVELLDKYSEVRLETEVAKALKAGGLLLPVDINKQLLEELDAALKGINKIQRRAMLSPMGPRPLSKTLVQRIIPLLESEDKDIRDTAISILKEIRTPEAEKALNDYDKMLTQ